MSSFGKKFKASLRDSPWSEKALRYSAVKKLIADAADELPVEVSAFCVVRQNAVSSVGAMLNVDLETISALIADEKDSLAGLPDQASRERQLANLESFVKLVRAPTQHARRRVRSPAMLPSGSRPCGPAHDLSPLALCAASCSCCTEPRVRARARRENVQDAADHATRAAVDLSGGVHADEGAPSRARVRARPRGGPRA